MNDLVPGELPTFTQLNEVTVFGDLAAVDADEAVATLHPALAADNSAIVAAYPGSLEAVGRCGVTAPQPQAQVLGVFTALYVQGQ
jgi:hypothetical protein